MRLRRDTSNEPPLDDGDKWGDHREDALLYRGYCRSEKSLGARFDTRSLRMSHCAYHSRRRAFSIYVAVAAACAKRNRSSEGMFFLAAVRAQKS